MWLYHVESLKALSSLQATITNFAANFLSSGLAGFFLIGEVLSARVVKLVRRRKEHTQATPHRSIDEKQLYYDVAGECSKGRVYGLGSLAKRKKRYEDLSASTSGEPMVQRSELNAVVQRLAQFEAFIESQLGMRMDFGASTFQAPPPPPPPPPPLEHHHQVGMDPTRSPQQQHDDDDEDNHDWLDEEHLGDES
ncbi:hypothetical protein Scep_004827 [Stephania cephalantha]|uniref:Uncharacterized protein n=1 Tax=Stephania cephalantha TaxID=152367 RepID=A0AAP0KUK2_9MAGN